MLLEMDQNGVIDRQSDLLGGRFRPVFNHDNRYNLPASRSFGNMFDGEKITNIDTDGMNDATNFTDGFGCVNTSRQVGHFNQNSTNKTDSLSLMTPISILLNEKKLSNNEQNLQNHFAKINNLPDWRLEKLFNFIPSDQNCNTLHGPSSYEGVSLDSIGDNENDDLKSQKPQNSNLLPPSLPFLATLLYHLNYLRLYERITLSQNEYNHNSARFSLLIQKIYYIFDLRLKRPLSNDQFDLLSWLLSYNSTRRPTSLQSLLHPALRDVNISAFEATVKSNSDLSH
jgi:hypothetical protein